MTDPTPSAPERVDIERLRAKIATLDGIEDLDALSEYDNARDDILAALSELSALREATTWRRFGDVRPADGQPCLVNIDGDLFTAKFEASSPDWDSLADGPQWSRSARSAHLWLPLPQPPREVQP